MQNIFLMVTKIILLMLLDCLKQAYDEGARWLVLCDTNGGTLPHEVGEIIIKSI